MCLLASHALALAPSTALLPGETAAPARSDASIRLFALYGIADNSNALKKRWLPVAPDWCEPRFLELPWHGGRSREDPPAYALRHAAAEGDALEAGAARRRALAEEIADDLAPFLDEPYAFYGFSLGAIVLYEVALVLKARGRPLPRRLVACGRGAPHCCPAARRHYAAVASNDDEFVLGWMRDRMAFETDRLPARIRRRAARLFRMGVLLGVQPGGGDDAGTPLTWGSVGDAATAAMPLLAPPAPLDVPITAIGSDADALWPPATLDRWADVAATTRVDVAGVAHGDLMNDPGAVAAVFAALEEHA